MGEVQYQLMTADPPVVTAAMEEDDSELAARKLLGQRSSLIPTLPPYYQTRRVYGGGHTVSFHGTDTSKVPTPNSDGAAVEEDSVVDTLDCSVYLDQRRRKWKCRHCDWTDNSSYGPGNRRSWKCRHCNWNSSNPSRLVNHEITGTESVDGGKTGVLFKGLNHQNGRLSASSLTSPNGSSEQQPTVRWSYRNGGLDSMEQTKEGVTQFGVEAVIEKQDTLDLYCPDCSSCITKRVILKKRKHDTPNGHRKLEEENKSVAANHPKAVSESSRPPLDQDKDIVGVCPDNSSIPPAVNDSFDEGEPDLFRCFSCFRFFIPQELQADDPAPATEGLVQAPRVPLPGNQTYMAEQRGGNGGGESYRWEILKSVVFGGLIESIISLGVVSSAAGAGAGTLNVLVMGLANLIGGLVIISCNILDLKHDYSRFSAVQEEDCYQKTLGKRENFALHFSAAILSFLVCGLLPTVTYGFTFQTGSNGDINKEEKLIAAGGVSLLCIILLAIGKAHIQNKQQLKGYAGTVIYFFSIWMATSGTCYLVGDLIKKLIITTTPK
ncbi:Membrane protein of ER body 2 [Linum grandiflorum]